MRFARLSIAVAVAVVAAAALAAAAPTDNNKSHEESSNCKDGGDKPKEDHGKSKSRGDHHRDDGDHYDHHRKHHGDHHGDHHRDDGDHDDHHHRHHGHPAPPFWDFNGPPLDGDNYHPRPHHGAPHFPPPPPLYLRSDYGFHHGHPSYDERERHHFPPHSPPPPPLWRDGTFRFPQHPPHVPPVPGLFSKVAFNLKTGTDLAKGIPIVLDDGVQRNVAAVAVFADTSTYATLGVSFLSPGKCNAVEFDSVTEVKLNAMIPFEVRVAFYASVEDCEKGKSSVKHINVPFAGAAAPLSCDSSIRAVRVEVKDSIHVSS